MPAAARPLLIVAEGPDGAGKSTALDRLARWLERKGRRVSVVEWAPSALVRTAAAGSRSRRALTPRVSALLTAADDLRQAGREIRPRLRGDRIVLLDRYAWTAVARDAARGLELGWAGGLRSPLPVPDLVVLFRQAPDVIVQRALANRPPSELTATVGAAFREFAERVMTGHDGLVATAADGSARPWPVAVVVIEPGLDPAAVDDTIRGAIRPLLTGERHGTGRIEPRSLAA